MLKLSYNRKKELINIATVLFVVGVYTIIIAGVLVEYKTFLAVTGAILSADIIKNIVGRL
jgi:low temperature requirement protein LtrA